MRVAMLSPIAWRTPPRHYGPWESVVSLLTEGLVRRGIEVTLCATADSLTSAKLKAVCPSGYEEDRALDPKVWECLHISELFECADQFDLIHNHFDFLPLTYMGMTATPVLTTIHGFSSPKILPVYKKYNGRAYYVAISNADRHSELDYIATIHHGIDLDAFPFKPEQGEYLLFFSRIHPDKGAREAIEIARKAGKRLLMAGIIQDGDYFEAEVKPHLEGDRVEYVGSVGPERRKDLLGGAFALIHPVNFEEPFGLSVVEAMACGTPVVAFSRGSMPELVVEGVTGFLVTTIDEAVKALGRIPSIPRIACRRWVEKKFRVERMVEDYIRVYERILSEHRREDHRPWGFYRTLCDEPHQKVKKIVVYPGQRLSLQRHRYRDEHWFLVQGLAVVTRNSEEIRLKAGQSTDIPRGTWHRVMNPGSEELIFIEVQTGDYFGEEDIERIEDDYGRAAQSRNSQALRRQSDPHQGRRALSG
ncbi:MAG: glycosyltransferase [Deltaproteobacteria bacterium]|nr:glycosyltransferase [Deltaproteobacteria bacterium]